MINPFKKTFTEKEKNIFVFLSQINLFSGLNYKEMVHFLPHLHERTFEKDEVVFFRNDPSHALYLLRKGEVSLNLDVNDSFEHLTTAKPGNAIGVSCLLKKAKRQLNAIVKSEKADFYVVPQENIFSIFEDNIKIKAKMLEAIATSYNIYNAELFTAYRNSSGFFNLRQVYNNEE